MALPGKQHSRGPRARPVGSQPDRDDDRVWVEPFQTLLDLES